MIKVTHAGHLLGGAGQSMCGAPLDTVPPAASQHTGLSPAVAAGAGAHNGQVGVRGLRRERAWLSLRAAERTLLLLQHRPGLCLHPRVFPFVFSSHKWKQTQLASYLNGNTSFL